MKSGQALGLAELGLRLLHVACGLGDAGPQCWGYNYVGQVGTGTAGGYNTSPTTPTGIGALVSIAASEWDSAGFDASGAAMAWGLNSGGEAGTGDRTEHDMPTAFMRPPRRPRRNACPAWS